MNEIDRNNSTIDSTKRLNVPHDFRCLFTASGSPGNVDCKNRNNDKKKSSRDFKHVTRWKTHESGKYSVVLETIKK